MKGLSGKSSLSLLAQIGLLMGPFLSMMDSNIVNVAVSDISKTLHSDVATVQWVISAYLVALSGALAASSYLAKRFGTLRVYVVSIVGFTVGSALCALSPNLECLIAARIGQGIMGAPLVPMAMGMLMGNHSRKVSPIIGMLLFLAPAIGPTIGGILLHFAEWPSIFLINIPIGFIGVMAALRVPRDTSNSGNKELKLDITGLILLALGLIGVVYGAANGARLGWLTAQTWPYIGGGGTLLIAYIVWSLKIKYPIVDIRVFGNRRIALAILLCILTSVVVFSMIVIVPIFMETVQHYTPLQTGLSLIPQAIVTGVGAVVSDILARRFGVRGSAAAGMTLLTAGTVLMLYIQAGTSAWVTSFFLIVRGIAIGFVIQQLLKVALLGLTQAQTAEASTLFNISQRLGGAIGIALISTFYQTRQAIHLQKAIDNRSQIEAAATNGFHDTIGVLSLLSAVGLCLAFGLKKESKTSESALHSPLSE